LSVTVHIDLINTYSLTTSYFFATSYFARSDLTIILLLWEQNANDVNCMNVIQTSWVM